VAASQPGRQPGQKLLAGAFDLARPGVSAPLGTFQKMVQSNKNSSTSNISESVNALKQKC